MLMAVSWPVLVLSLDGGGGEQDGGETQGAKHGETPL
jgi:hypothetical protein